MLLFQRPGIDALTSLVGGIPVCDTSPNVPNVRSQAGDFANRHGIGISLDVSDGCGEAGSTQTLRLPRRERDSATRRYRYGCTPRVRLAGRASIERSVTDVVGVDAASRLREGWMPLIRGNRLELSGLSSALLSAGRAFLPPLGGVRHELYSLVFRAREVPAHSCESVLSSTLNRIHCIISIKQSPESGNAHGHTKTISQEIENRDAIQFDQGPLDCSRSHCNALDGKSGMGGFAFRGHRLPQE